jgi:hypothetical protein
MGNCYCCSSVQYNGNDGKQETTSTFDNKFTKNEPTYTSNQVYEVSERRGKSRRGGRPMITEG